MKKIIPFKFSWQTQEWKHYANALKRTAWESLQQGFMNHDLHSFMTHSEVENKKHIVFGGFWDINNSTKHHGHYVVEGDIIFRWESNAKIPEKYKIILEESALDEICERAKSGQVKGDLYEEIQHGRQKITYRGSWEVQYAV